MAHYTNHVVRIQDNADDNPIDIGSIIQASLPIDQEVLSEAVAGTYYPEQISVVSQKPKMNFTTFDLPKAIDALGLIGRSVIEGVSKPGIAMYQAKYNDSAVSAGSTHRRLRFAKSYSKISRISVSHRQDARAEVESMALWDDTNDPVTIETSQALPTLPTSPGRWSIGTVVVGGVTIGCKVQIDIDLGISAEAFGCDSDIWDTHLNLSEVKPVVKITSLDLEGFGASAVPLVGLAGTHVNSSIVLRKRLEKVAGWVDDETAEHIEITLDGTVLVTEAHSGTGNQQAQMQIEIHCRFDGTNAPLVFDTAFAIS